MISSTLRFLLAIYYPLSACPVYELLLDQFLGGRSVYAIHQLPEQIEYDSVVFHDSNHGLGRAFASDSPSGE